MKYLKNNYHWIIPLILLILSIIYILVSVYQSNNRIITYSFDDGYIHMAYAKNIVEHSVWGISKYESSATTSSMLWTLILSACYLIFGVGDISPLILNSIVIIILFILVCIILQKHLQDKILILSVLMLVFFSSKMLLIYMSGMEHLLFLIFAIVHITLTSYLIFDNKLNDKYVIIFYLNSVLLILTRYEGYIFAFITIILFIYFKKYKILFYFTCLLLLVVLSESIIKMNLTDRAVPNSFIVKTKIKYLFSNNPISDIITSFYNQLGNFKLFHYVFTLFVLGVFLFVSNIKFKRDLSLEYINYFYLIQTLLYTTIFITISNSFHFRYINLIIVLLLIVLFLNINLLHKYKILIRLFHKYYKVVILFCVIVFSVYTGVYDIYNTIRASENIYQQQYQMGLFINKYYSGSKILVNDVGAINYLSEFYNIDFVGLGNNIITLNTLNKDQNKSIKDYINFHSPKLGLRMNHG